QNLVTLVDQPTDVLDLRETHGGHGDDRVVRMCCGDVRGMQKSRAIEPNINEGGLHTGQHSRDASLIEIAHESTAARALDVNFLHDAVLDDCRKFTSSAR